MSEMWRGIIWNYEILLFVPVAKRGFHLVYKLLLITVFCKLIDEYEVVLRIIPKSGSRHQFDRIIYVCVVK